MPKRSAVPSKANTGASGKVKKTAKAFKFPEHIPAGFIVKDTQKKEWKIGETIGTGGFGEIYSACPVGAESSTKKSLFSNAIKVEPKENGPLYVEMHFYMRVAKEIDIEAWKTEKRLSNLGMPVLCGSGSFEYKANNYRFLVTDRFGKSLQAILDKNNKIFPLVTVLQIAVQVLNVLEYIHSKGYIHGDIKAANLLLGLKKGEENTVYIIDFGIAAKCAVTEKEFVRDPRKANNGTIEYISRDGHAGIFGFRGDLEMLGFNLIHWLNGSLPWQAFLTDTKAVEEEKTKLMSNPAKYIKSHLPKVTVEFTKYLEYVTSKQNNEIPDYDYCRKLFTTKLKALNCNSPFEKLCFDIDSEAKEATLKPKRKKNLGAADEKASNKAQKELPKKRASPKRNVIPEGSETESLPVVKKKKRTNVDDATENGVSNSEENRWKVLRSKQTAHVNGSTDNTVVEELNEDGEESEHDVKEKQVKRRPRVAKQAVADSKPSWRDAPTVVASNVKVAGEYKRNGGPSSDLKSKKKK